MAVNVRETSVNPCEGFLLMQAEHLITNLKINAKLILFEYQLKMVKECFFTVVRTTITFLLVRIIIFCLMIMQASGSLLKKIRNSN